MESQESFEEYLRRKEMAEHTVFTYLWTVNSFLEQYGSVSRENLMAYKGALIESYKPATVNVRIQAINKYLLFLEENPLLLKNVKVQVKMFAENIISDKDYRYLKYKLKQDGNMKWYLVVWYLAATGARVSELVKIRVEDVKKGYSDIYSKGGKFRRLYIPPRLQEETLEWLGERAETSGYLFVNRYGKGITTRGIGKQLKRYAGIYGLNPEVVYPHSFRHRYAKNFLNRYNDVALLADLMGHGSTETTRIYLRRTTKEQIALIHKIVNW